MNNARSELGSTVIQTAALAMGGEEPPGAVTRCETYDGSSWSTSPATLGTARTGAAAAGSSTASFIAGGPSASALTEEFNNTFKVVTAAAWASGPNLVGGQFKQAGAGTQTAAFSAGGSSGTGASVLNATYEFDGSSWTNGGTLPTPSDATAGAGTLAAGLAVLSYPATTNSFEYASGSWTTGGSLNTPRGYSNAAGTQTAALAMGGYAAPVNVNSSEAYDGSSWTATPNLNTARRRGAGAGTQTAGLLMCGLNPTSTPSSVNTEEYNGSSWTSVNNAIFYAYGNAGGGTQTAAYSCNHGSPNYGVQHYDGTTYATTAATTVDRYTAASGNSASPQAQGIIFGGINTGYTAVTATTEEFTGETTTDTASSIDFD